MLRTMGAMPVRTPPYNGPASDSGTAEDSEWGSWSSRARSALEPPGGGPVKDEPVAAESATGRGSSVDVGPDDNLLQAVRECFFSDRVDKALVKEARWSYAAWFGIPPAKVTMRTLENSHHGLRGWIKWAKRGESFDAPKDELACVSKDECARRIRRVLADRRAWLAENGLRHDVDMTNKECAAFHKWALEAFSREPSELERGGDSVGVRSRFNLEKQRRAGSPQLWQLLSFQGSVTETDVRSLAELCKQRKGEPGTDRGQCDEMKKRRARIAKDALRRAKSLQRRVGQKKAHPNKLSEYERNMLRDLENGTLRKTANHCVREQGRGRLRGAWPGEYFDIGTNQKFSVVAEFLDRPQKRPRTNRRCF